MSQSDRFLDAGLDVDLKNNSPLVDVDKAESLSLKEALERGANVSGLIGATLTSCLHAANMKAKEVQEQGPQPLNSDEIGAIHLYTQETPLYRNLNRLLRQRRRPELKPLFPYLKLLLTALHKLPSLETVVYRGVQENLSSKYVEGNDVVWWGFSSTTASLKVLKIFTGTSGPRTIFAITTAHAVDIRCYSAMEFEEERLLLPALQLKVVGKVDFGGGLHMIQLEEDRQVPSFIPGFQFGAPSSSSSSPNSQLAEQLWDEVMPNDGEGGGVQGNHATFSDSLIRVWTSCHGTKLRCYPDGQVDLAPHAQEWEQWRPIWRGGNTYVWKSRHGSYLRAHPDGRVDAAPHAQEWEHWQYLGRQTFNGHSGHVWKSFHGLFLSGWDDGKVKTEPHIQEWELWN